MSAQNEDFLFAQEAEKLGYISEQQVEEAFLLQRRMAEDLKIDERLAVILVKRGWLAEEQARRVYAIIEPKGASQQIEGYRLVAKIGRGAMGTVYKAIHERLNRPVAIKILRRDLATDKTQIERLKGEAQLLASLDHPNIVRAIDAGESNGFPYFVMEYVEGENLRDAIIRKGPFEEDDALRITRDLALALERARRMGVVHRDVKPGNVLLTRRGNIPKLMDLGLAKGPIDLGLTQMGSTVGTPQFISPEQAQDPREADTRSDIYSLGATLYAMLTSRPPFEGSTLAEIITKVLYEQPTPLRVLNDDVSPEVSYLVERMMLKDPSLRHRTPADVAEDIDRIRGGQSIVPQGFTGNWEAFLLRRRMKRWIRRGAIAGVALIVLTVSAWMFFRHQAREEAMTEISLLEDQILDISLLPFEEPLVFRGTSLLARLESLRTEAAGRASDVQKAFARAHEKRGYSQRFEQVADTEGPRHDAVEARLERLQELRDDYEELGSLATGLLTRFPADPAKRSFSLAVADVDAARSARDGRPASPVVDVLQDVSHEIVAASESALRVVVSAASVRSRQPTTLEDLEGPWIACAQDLASRRFCETKNLTTFKSKVDDLLTEFNRIRRDAEQLQGDFETPLIAPRVEKGEVGALVAEFRQRRQDLERDIRDHLKPFAADKFVVVGPDRVLGEGRPVARMLTMTRATLDAAVRARTTDLLQQAQVELDRTPFAPQQVGVLIQDLLAWQKALRNNYDELEEQVQQVLGIVRKRHLGYLGEFEKYFTDTRESAFSSLTAGKPDELLRMLDQRVEGRNAQWGPDPRLDQLRWGGRSLSELQDRALRALEKRLVSGQTKVERVRLRDRVDDRWKLLRVDPEHGVIHVEVRNKGKRPEVQAVSVSRVHPEQLLAFVSASVSPRLHAVAALSAMPPAVQKPGIDLRPVLQAWAGTQAAFESLSEDEALAPWVDFVAREHGKIVGWQDEREGLAGEIEKAAGRYIAEEKWVEARDRLKRLMDPKDRYRYTKVFDELEDQIHNNHVAVAQALERNQWLAYFPGAKLEVGINRRLRVYLDWDTPEFQKQNILHGLGEFERQPADDGRITPSQVDEPYQLHLLKGETSFVRDRPLAFPQFFDPADPIEFEATIQTLAGSFLLAIDIDGVKVAVCSADPRLYDRRFGPDAPLLDDELKLPEFDFYGMGRGVAFHKAATNNFGSNFFDTRIWTWPRAGRGRNFKAWRDASKLEDPKAALFAFERGKRYRIRVVRDRDRMRLYAEEDLDGRRIERAERLVAEMQVTAWGRVGTNSDSVRDMVHGTGRIQLLTWTPLIVDDVVLSGTLSRRWEADRKRQLEEEQLVEESKAETKEGK